MDLTPQEFTEEDIEEYIGEYIRVFVTSNLPDGGIRFDSNDGILINYELSYSPPPRLLSSITMKIRGMEKEIDILEIHSLFPMDNPKSD